MTSEHKVVYLGSAKPTQSALELVDAVRRLTVKRLASLLRHMLDNVDDALFNRAERAESDTTQELYFFAMRQMRLRRREIEEAFQRELLADFRMLTGAVHTRPADAADSGLYDSEHELGLVEEDTLELSVAVDAMVSRARSRYPLPLEQLRTRIDYLLSDRQVNEKNNPLDPKLITDAFVRASDPAEIPIQPRLIILKLFEKYVLGQLPGLYDEANRQLIDAGVLPKLSPGGRQATSGGTRRAPSAPSSASGAAAEDQGQSQSQGQQGGGNETFELIHQLLAATKYGPGDAQWTGSGYVGGSSAAASFEDVMSALSNLQQDRSVAESAAGELNIKSLLSQRLSSGGEQRSLGRSEDDTIDIVSMLFDVILDDLNLPDSIKALIARLQIPVLKVALADKTFFSSKAHPARALINELARSAVGWTEPQDLSRDPLYRQVESVVNRILVGFGSDVSLFQSLLDEFRGFLEQERERARQVEERTRQAAEGKAKVDTAKALVEREIAERVGNQSLPPVVRRLLDEAWAKVLFITYLKEGSSENFYHQLSVVDRLLTSIAPPPDPVERQQLLKEIPGLLHDLREGLNAILFNPFEMTKVFKELESIHVSVLARPGTAPAAEPPRRGGEREGAESRTDLEDDFSLETMELEGSAEGGPADAVSDETQREREEYIARLAEVAVGTWFEFGDAGGNCVRAKLSARLNGGRRLIFVNRAGFKLADRILEDMADDLCAGRAVILDDNLLFDKALETVITNLRNMRAG